MNEPLSACCHAKMRVAGDDREVTRYYVCTKCGKPCDPARDNKQEAVNVRETN